ncbi:serine/arginine repetitive matrix protein 1-like [Lineus longissimus]|uniref:serine/arginine repetitive matrix protein 1-like n=1 Tax=Lineus longissimus TaxID=88925 RepID=UPI00315CE409
MQSTSLLDDDELSESYENPAYRSDGARPRIGYARIPLRVKMEGERHPRTGGRNPLRERNEGEYHRIRDDYRDDPPPRRSPLPPRRSPPQPRRSPPPHRRGSSPRRMSPPRRGSPPRRVSPPRRSPPLPRRGPSPPLGPGPRRSSPPRSPPRRRSPPRSPPGRMRRSPPSRQRYERGSVDRLHDRERDRGRPNWTGSVASLPGRHYGDRWDPPRDIEIGSPGSDHQRGGFRDRDRGSRRSHDGDRDSFRDNRGRGERPRDQYSRREDSRGSRSRSRDRDPERDYDSRGREYDPRIREMEKGQNESKLDNRGQEFRNRDHGSRHGVDEKRDIRGRNEPMGQESRPHDSRPHDSKYDHSPKGTGLPTSRHNIDHSPRAFHDHTPRRNSSESVARPQLIPVGNSPWQGPTPIGTPLRQAPGIPPRPGVDVRGPIDPRQCSAGNSPRYGPEHSPGISGNSPHVGPRHGPGQIPTPGQGQLGPGLGNDPRYSQSAQNIPNMRKDSPLPPTPSSMPAPPMDPNAPPRPQPIEQQAQDATKGTDDVNNDLNKDTESEDKLKAKTLPPRRRKPDPNAPNIELVKRALRLSARAGTATLKRNLNQSSEEKEKAQQNQQNVVFYQNRFVVMNQKADDEPDGDTGAGNLGSQGNRARRPQSLVTGANQMVQNKPESGNAFDDYMQPATPRIADAVQGNATTKMATNRNMDIDETSVTMEQQDDLEKDSHPKVKTKKKKNPILAKIASVLQDDRGGKGSVGFSPGEETHRVLKRVLNIIFVTIGILLFIAVVVVIIYTSIGKVGTNPDDYVEAELAEVPNEVPAATYGPNEEPSVININHIYK